ncbi:hypothetical protein [Xylophilus sp. ASV27]|uniref:hypothetical protein n=1 Tax=Xylophilus sp. ASV27 TaxID=2795129 RepID=UPI001E420E76|nr:hypothetical protein [Xylophilus sp. ASV27]
MTPACRPALRPLSWLLAAALLAGAGPLPAWAAKKEAQAAKADGSTTRKAKRPRATHPKVLPGGSGETTAERERRLLRECRGLPNAGACLGLAS